MRRRRRDVIAWWRAEYLAQRISSQRHALAWTFKVVIPGQRPGLQGLGYSGWFPDKCSAFSGMTDLKFPGWRSLKFPR